MMDKEMREWRLAFAATQIALHRSWPVTPEMENRLYQASCALYEAEDDRLADGVAAVFERKRRIRRVGETTAARWAAGYGR